MIRKALLAVLALGVCSTSAFAQDIYVTFSDTSISKSTTPAGSGPNDPAVTPPVFNGSSADVASATILGNSLTAAAGDTGTAFVMVNSAYDVSQVDRLVVSASSPGVTINSADLLQFEVFGGAFTRWTEPAAATIDGTGSSFELFGTNFGGLAADGNPASNGIQSAFAAQDAGHRAGDGFILAQFDYTVVSPGTHTFDFTSGGVLQGSTTVELASIATAGATLEVSGGEVVPEPSSAVLLILGAAGMVARRRRS